MIEMAGTSFVAVLTAPRGPEAMQALASYTLQATEGRPEDIRAFFRTLGPPAEEAFMSALDKAFAQERAKVLEQGRVEGEAGLLLRQLTRRFGPLPTEVQSRVRHGRSEDLELWAERVLSASSLQAVFDDAR